MKKLNVLKSFVLRFYEYNYYQETKSEIVTELLTALKGKHTFRVTSLQIILLKLYIYIFLGKWMNGLDTAIILIAKKEGPKWTYKNIIQSVLLPMIKDEHPCKSSAFPLLGMFIFFYCTIFLMEEY